MAQQNAEYLGDGIYIHYDDKRLMVGLTTGNHDPKYADNTIWFEPNEFLALRRWMDRHYPPS